MHQSARASMGAASVAVAVVALLSFGAHAEVLDTIEHPTRVPAFAFISLGNGIEPGGSGVYGFSLTNRYNSSLNNVSLTVELYRWATVKEELNITSVGSPPRFSLTHNFTAHFDFASIAANASVQVRLQVDAPRDAPEGVYFTRHYLEFDYGNVTEPPAPAPYSAHFVMKSRGYFTDAEFESINYSDLRTSLQTLGVAGVIPDSSFSVRPPAPIWPLATLVVATAVSGTMALLYTLVDQRPGKYRRVERALLRLEGKVRVWRAIVRGTIAARMRLRPKPPKGA